MYPMTMSLSLYKNDISLYTLNERFEFAMHADVEKFPFHVTTMCSAGEVVRVHLQLSATWSQNQVTIQGHASVPLNSFSGHIIRDGI